MSNYDSLTTFDGRTLDPEATFTHGEYESRQTAKSARGRRAKQAAVTWLGRRTHGIVNEDDLSPKGVAVNLVSCALSSLEVDWKYSDRDYGDVPRTREMAALIEALEVVKHIVDNELS